MTDSSLNIREAVAADYDGAVPLMTSDFATHRRARPDIYKAGVQANYDLETFRSLIAGPASALYVADRQRQIVGLAALMLKEIPETLVGKARRLAEIDYITVNDRLRRQGIGRALFEACRAKAAAWEVEALVLNVFDFNQTAIAFYEALSFSPMYRRMHLKMSGMGL